MEEPQPPQEAPRSRSASPFTWAVPLAVTLLSFAGVILSVGLRSGSFDVGAAEEGAVAEATPTPRRTVAPAVATPAAAATPGRAVRVTKAAGTAEALASGGYRVWFTWLLEGARDGDPVTIRVAAGSQQLGEQRGVLGPGVFDPSTATLTLSTTAQCSSDGWSAELVSIREQRLDGDPIARVAGVTCR